MYASFALSPVSQFVSCLESAIAPTAAAVATASTAAEIKYSSLLVSQKQPLSFCANAVFSFHGDVFVFFLSTRFAFRACQGELFMAGAHEDLTVPEHLVTSLKHANTLRGMRRTSGPPVCRKCGRIVSVLTFMFLLRFVACKVILVLWTTYVASSEHSCC